MISAGDFRNGVTFEMDNNVFQVVEFQHVKPGKGSAFVRTKYRNVKTGAVVERSFNPNEKFEEVRLERRDMEYLYHDGDLYYFMDQETYEQVPFTAEMIGDNLKFLKENMVCKVVSHNGTIFSVELPLFVELKIVQTEPGVKGDTAQNATKNAVLETGANIKIPLFVNEGEVVRIDTRTGQYMERA
ncbi:elongation factor P [Oscillospiraceae bacterium HV4-5-C5C]|nr:elongation factor P [Oscillospiraceae bacterium]MDD4368347.1 elongation factor P [Oscillospiraceae bacterium]NJP39493.1 elongation factor P [Oscillospiraceae bacterium HV4-5-C5C]